MNPPLELEVGDAECWLPAVGQRQDVGQSVAEGSLTVAPALAGEERRPRLGEATAFKTLLRL
jgi:hypothetical protein